MLIKNGVQIVAEGANMPTTLEATELLQKSGVTFGPGKAANAGGVATSALEMSQNSQRLSWSFEEVDCQAARHHDLASIRTLTTRLRHTATRATMSWAANIAGFMKVADAMMAQGVV